jgi:hypothetical protein
MPQPLRGQRSDRIVRKENSELGRVSYGCTCPAGRVRRIKSTRSDACFEDIMSYLVRRSMCGLTPKNYNTIFLELLKKFTGTDGPNAISRCPRHVCF